MTSLRTASGLAAASIVLLAACGSSAPSTVSVTGSAATSPTTATPTTTSTSTPPASTTEPTAQVPVECGSELPIFAVELTEGQPGNVDGTPGPGPESTPSEAGQIVSHWLSEYGTYELRWPPSVDVSPSDDWPLEVAGFRAQMITTEEETASLGRAIMVFRLDDDDQRCSLASAEVYGPIPDALIDSIGGILDSLRNRSELDGYLRELDNASTRSDAGAELDPGRCAEPLPTGVDEHGYVPLEIAAELVTRFMSDRVGGLRAQQCMTVSGFRTYEQSTDPDLEPCLFECSDGSQLIGPTPPQIAEFGWSDYGTQVSNLVEFGPPGKTARESIDVGAGKADDGSMVALITRVVALPESYVTRDAAEAFISEFLDRLATGEFSAAAGQLVNEGYFESVEELLGDVYVDDVGLLLASYCETALCGAPYEILPGGATSLFGRGVIVRFTGPTGVVDVTIGVGSFEATLSIGNLPPRR